MLQVQLDRIDWTLIPGAQEAHEGFLSVGPVAEALESFVPVVSKWLPLAPPLRRLALGMVLHDRVNAVADGYGRLADLLPIKLDPIGSSDLAYQINRPRPSTAVPGLTINRLSKWSVASLNYQILAVEPHRFEYLIRDLFEKEFARNGGEVKVTQASRDRGVDAVIFDPDPLHGGKVIVQAKRYTNTVDVSAVRDLYGTVINEGASRGILVTTSNYGRDAHDFAKNKPIILLNGANLLHLLTKHGYALKIDLKEAKDLRADLGA